MSQFRIINGVNLEEINEQEKLENMVLYLIILNLNH